MKRFKLFLFFLLYGVASVLGGSFTNTVFSGIGTNAQTLNKTTGIEVAFYDTFFLQVMRDEPVAVGTFDST